MSNISFQIEVVKEEGGCRTILRDWVEIEGYLEIAYQEYNKETRQWVDFTVTPAMSKQNCKNLYNCLDIAMENFLE